VDNEKNQTINQKPENASKHVLSFVLMIALTAAAFYLVGSNVVPSNWILPMILIFAVIQVFLQLFTFMHLDQKGSAYYTIFMAFGILVAVISAVGIIIM
jgi:cytochrome c oxidase subunit 4